MLPYSTPHFYFPFSPAASGEQDSIEYEIKDVTISGLSATATPTLHPDGTMITLAVSNLALETHASIHLKEKHWPHPSMTANVKATSSSSSAAVGISVTMDPNHKPVISLDSCTASISLKVTVSKLGIFDKLADLLVKQFKGSREPPNLFTEMCIHLAHLICS